MENNKSHLETPLRRQPDQRGQSSSEEELRLHRDFHKGHDGNKSTYVVEKIVVQIRAGSDLWCVVQWYRYINSNDTAEPPHHIP